MSETTQDHVVTRVKDLKELGPAPDGHVYAGTSLAYWCKDEDAFKCYDYCKWESGGRKQQVIVEVVPDVPSLTFHQGSTCTWDRNEHESCPHCRIVFRRIQK